MKLRIMSDLHLEFNTNVPVHELSDDRDTVMVLAGDISTGHSATEFIQPLLSRFKAVIYVLGNHEFYGSRIDKVQQFWSSSADHHDNLYVLNDSSVVIDDVKFIGSTLWTDMDNGSPITKMDALQWMNDYSRITINDYGHYMKIQPKHTISMHMKSRVYIQEELRKGFDGKTVVVTHHAPLPACVHDKYRGDPLNGCYHSNLENIFAEYDFNLWIHGHMHDSVYLDDVYGKRVISNPHGYGGADLNPLYDPEMVIEV